MHGFSLHHRIETTAWSEGTCMRVVGNPYDCREIPFILYLYMCTSNLTVKCQEEVFSACHFLCAWRVKVS